MDTDKMKDFISAPILLFICMLLTIQGSLAQGFGVSSRDVTGINSLYELCPYTDFCASNATNLIEDRTKTQCCRSCSCADNCWERGNCCKDKQMIATRKPIERCEAKEVNDDKKNNWGYYVIKSCPSDRSPLAKKCSGEVKTSLEDSVWVTDRRTNKIYGNKHCAECHGVTDYDQWQLATDCTKVINGTNTPEEVLNAFMDHCSLTVEPPSAEDHENNICLIPEITTCNVTGQWKVYDKTIETACHSFQQNYVHEQFFRTIIYKNIYCFLCNSQHRLVYDICRPLKDAGRTTTQGFIALIDFNKIERKMEDVTSTGCAVDEIKDHFQKRCLKLTCPLLQTPVHGQCVRVLSSTRMLGVQAMLVFHPVWVKANNATQGYDFHFDSAARNLSKIVGQGFGRCKPCELVVFAKYSNKTAAINGHVIPERFSMSMVFQTSEKCQESLIVERINELFANEIKLPIGTESITLIISTVPQEESTQYMQLDGDMLSLSLKCPMRIAPIADYYDLSKCPTVSLNYTDYTTLMKSTEQMSKKKLINSIFKQTANFNNVPTKIGTNVAGMDHYATNRGNDVAGMGNGATNRDNNVAGMGNGATNRGNNVAGMGNGATNRDNTVAGMGNDATNRDNNVAGMGNDATNRDNNVAGMGNDATNRDNNVAGMGNDATNRGNNVAGVGNGATNRGNNVAGMGNNATNRGNNVAGMGNDETNRGNNVAGMDNDAINRNNDVAGMGNDATNRGNNVAGISNDATNSGNNVAGIGNDATNRGNNVAGMDNDAINRNNNVAGMGNDATNMGNNVAGMGNDATNRGNNVAGMGNDATNRGNNVAGMGNDATNRGNNVAGMGNDATNMGNNVAGMGNDATNSGNNVAGMGNDATNMGNNVAGMGNDATNRGNNVAGMGNDATNRGNNVAGMGHDATNRGNNVAGMGIGATNRGNNVAGMGNDATNRGNNVAGMGHDATNRGNNVAGMGNDATNRDNNMYPSDTENKAATMPDNAMIQVCAEAYLSVLPKEYHTSASGHVSVVTFVMVMTVSMFWALT